MDANRKWRPRPNTKTHRRRGLSSDPDLNIRARRKRSGRDLPTDHPPSFGKAAGLRRAGPPSPVEDRLTPLPGGFHLRTKATVDRTEGRHRAQGIGGHKKVPRAEVRLAICSLPANRAGRTSQTNSDGSRSWKSGKRVTTLGPQKGGGVPFFRTPYDIETEPVNIDQDPMTTPGQTWDTRDGGVGVRA